MKPDIILHNHHVGRLHMTPSAYFKYEIFWDNSKKSARVNSYDEARQAMEGTLAPLEERI